jgi:hypothetical protein
LELLNNIKMRSLFVFLLVFGMAAVGYPAQVEHAPAFPKTHLVLDSSKIVVQHFQNSEMNVYRKDKAFVYDRDEVRDEGFWSRFWNWLWRIIRSWFGDAKPNVPQANYFWFVKYIVIAVLAGLVVFIIVKVIGLDLKIFARKSKAIEVPYAESMDNIHEINFEDEIEKAVSGGNYRLAVRLFYLNTLKKLNDQQLIDWQPEKTNQDYITELAGLEKQQGFKQLTLQFEYVWYGEFFINRENFTEIKALFDQFNLKRV